VGAEAIRLHGAQAAIDAGGLGLGGDLYLREPTGSNTIRFRAHSATGYLGGNGEEGELRFYPASGDNESTNGSSVRIDGGSGAIRAGGDGVNGQILVRASSFDARVRLDAATGSAHVGGNGNSGEVHVYPSSGDNETSGQAVIRLAASTGSMTAGGAGVGGELYLRDGDGSNRVRLMSSDGNVHVGGNGEDGDVLLYPSAGNNFTASQAAIHLNAAQGEVVAGGGGIFGDVYLRNGDGENRIRLRSHTATAHIGGNGEEGNLYLYAADGDNATTADATVAFDGAAGNLRLGGGGNDGDLLLNSGAGERRIHLDADTANGYFGGNGEEGDILLFASGGNQADGSTATIHLDGGNGDIVLRNADFAEDFDVREAVMAQVEPGTVMVLDDDGKLVPCTEAYDRRVAGAISGAGDYRPGIIMDKQDDSTHRLPVALMGKVFVKVDAAFGAIATGDLLTTSPTPGHAMKADDPKRSHGAVLGKALAGFDGGTGMVPMLVVLQ
ncbi:MAG: hypothetical protein AAGN66_29895, partial [Acidobacteriota bacterium]